jgi:hypothetical protein
MSVHLPALNHGRVDPASALYTIRIKGHPGATLLSAFPAMAWHRHGQIVRLTREDGGGQTRRETGVDMVTRGSRPLLTTPTARQAAAALPEVCCQRS